MRKAGLIIAAVAVGGCARVNTVSHQTLPAPRTMPAMERQIRNAVDAGEGDAEVRELRRRLAVNPDDIPARLRLAARYRESGVPDLAIEHLRIAASRAPHLSEIYIRLAQSLHDSGATGEAIGTLLRFCDREPAPPVELVSMLGIYLDDEGRHADAEPHHRAAVKLAPAKPAIHNNLGYNLLLQGKLAEAVASFRRAVALDPRSEVAHNNLGTALAMLPGSEKEAVIEWQSVSDPATAHSNLASVLIEQKRYAEARHELEIALSYSRGHAAALGNLALLGELDAGHASAVLPLRASSWQRFTSGLRRALAGTKSETATGAQTQPPAQAASK